MVNVFRFEFSAEDHLQLILHRGTWTFDNQVVVMARLKAGDSPSSVNLNWVDFWIHVLDVSFDWFTRWATCWGRVLVL